MTRILTHCIDSIGAPVAHWAKYTKETFLMVYLAARGSLLEQTHGFREVVSVTGSQIYFTGWQAIPLVTVLALTTGSIVILNTAEQTTLFGNENVLGRLLHLIVIQELGPLVIALVVIARSGTAVASELGNMKANREFEALQTMAINPLSFIVFPRVAGGIMSVLCLAFYFNIIGIVGSYFTTHFVHQLALETFLNSVAQQMTVKGTFMIMLKNGFNGVLIFSVCCFQGLRVQQSHHEVPQVTTQAVVISISTVTALTLAFAGLNYFKNFGGLL